MPNIYKTLHVFRDVVSSAGQTSGWKVQAEQFPFEEGALNKPSLFFTNSDSTGIAAVSFINTSNVIKKPQCQAPTWHTWRDFGGKPHCLITCPNMTISVSLKTCKFENFGSSAMPKVSGRPQNTPLVVKHITLSNVVNRGFLHNYVIPFTRLRKYWLFIAIKGPDCKKQVKVSGYF